MKKLVLLLALLLMSCSCTSEPALQLKCPTEEPDFFEAEWENVRMITDMICNGCSFPLVAIERKQVDNAQIDLSIAIVAYNKNYMSLQARKYGWNVPFVIFAHEAGHWIDYYAGDPTTELSADKWSGCMYAIAGRDLDGVEMLFASFTGDSDHPDGGVRKKAFVEGFNVCWEIFK